MAISFNTGTTASTSSALTASQAITIPAGVNAGDIIIVAFSAFRLATTAETMQASSTGTTPVIIGSSVQCPAFSSDRLTAAIFSIVAGASESGKVITGSLISSDTAKWAASLGVWTGASNVTPIDVNGAATASGLSSTVTCPSETTGVDNDWDIQILAAALAGAAYTGPSGFTQREKIINATSGVASAIYDSNASVGPAGTSIGGANFANSGNNSWWAAFTVGLAPAVAAGTIQPVATFPTPRRRLSRVVTGFIPVTTINTGHGPAGTVQPLAVPAAMPRRPLSRTVTQFIPVTTTNNLHPIAAAPQPPPLGGGKSMLGRYMRWADL